MVSYNPSTVWKAAERYDDDLRRYFMKVYRYMSMALGITALVAFAVGSSYKVSIVLHTPPLSWVLALAPLAYVFFFASRVTQMSQDQAVTHLSLFSTLNGLSLGSIFIVYTASSISKMFLVSAGMFAAISLYGYTTKRDLTLAYSFAIMGLAGLVIASLVHLLLPSGRVSFLLSVIGVIVFTVLTAAETQKLKSIYYAMHGNNLQASNLAVYGALSLYLNFINLFLSFLTLFGVKREN